MRSAPVTPEAARAQIRAKYDRHAGTWAAAEDLPRPLVTLPLHPPTERAALDHEPAARDWVRSWTEHRDAHDSIVWQQRRWASLGTQRVPERLVLDSPEQVARWAGRSTHWSQLSERFIELLERVPGNAAALRAALPRLAQRVVELDAADVDRLLGVLVWLAEHPASGLFIRQLPIRGVDTKWVSRHRSLVEKLHRAASGRDGLGLSSPPDLVRLRFLDAALAPGGLRDVSSPLPDVARLVVSPAAVVVVENLETLLALPPIPGTVAIHGRGYAVDHLDRIPWASVSRLLYWGDLDTHGFAILHRLRSRGVTAESVLMDAGTLLAFRDLWVPEPEPATGRMDLLTADEQQAVRLLREAGGVRLEQERIDWSHALTVLRATLDAPG